MLDIHAHLFWKSYDADRDGVILRARAAGVTKMICVGTEPEDNPLALGVAEKYEGVYASVGIHPHFFNDYVEKECQIPNAKYQILTNKEAVLEKIIPELRSIAQSSDKVIAIGECGLDYFSRDPEKPITEDQKAAQKAGFVAQLELAHELKLPIIIHCRNAYEDMFDILQATSYKLPAVLHCYQSDTEITKKFLELPNVYFSFAGNITYPAKKALVGTIRDIRETVALVPLERIFTETDCPFLAPQGKRGERNEPAFVVETAQCLAALKGISIDELNQKVTENSERVFWKDVS